VVSRFVEACRLGFSSESKLVNFQTLELKMNVLIYRAFGELVSGFVTKEVASMGIRALKWIRRGAVLAIDAYDDTFKLINVSTWMPFAEITLPSTVDTALVKVYFEEHDAKKKLFECIHVSFSLSYGSVDKTREGSIKMAELVKSENEGRRAFSCMEESASGRFLLLRRGLLNMNPFLLV